MLTRQRAKEIAKNTVKESIIAFARNKLGKKPKFQILDLIIPKERKIRSIVGGLETSLGRTLWEPLAKGLAIEDEFEDIYKTLESPINIPSNLNNTIQNIIDDRKRKNGVYNATSSHAEIKRICQIFRERPIEGHEKAPKGFGVDVWLKKGGVNYFFDTKTVQPNIGSLTKFMEQIINWYAFFIPKTRLKMLRQELFFPIILMIPISGREQKERLSLKKKYGGLG